MPPPRGTLGGTLRRSLRGLCPNCGVGKLFKARITVVDECSHCGIDLTRYHAGDGPASLLILVYGAIIVPLAFLVENMFAPPLWVQAVIWGLVMTIATMLSLRLIKAIMVGLAFRLQTPE